MKIRIKKAGLMATVQDLGRHHYLSQGVPVSGAMDTLSAQIANLAVGNQLNDAVIEFTQTGATFVTESDILICLSGAGACLRVESGRLSANRPLFIPSELIFTWKTRRRVAGHTSRLPVDGMCPRFWAAEVPIYQPNSGASMAGA